MLFQKGFFFFFFCTPTSLQKFQFSSILFFQNLLPPLPLGISIELPWNPRYGTFWNCKIFYTELYTFLYYFISRCQWCPKTYEQLEGLRRHIRQHVGDEKFVCKDCGKKFITSIQLKRHLWLSHDQDSPYRRSIL